MENLILALNFLLLFLTASSIFIKDEIFFFTVVAWTTRQGPWVRVNHVWLLESSNQLYKKSWQKTWQLWENTCFHHVSLMFYSLNFALSGMSQIAKMVTYQSIKHVYPCFTLVIKKCFQHNFDYKPTLVVHLCVNWSPLKK